MLFNLPDDIILAILQNLEAPDLLVIQQTCRGLHDLATADFIWRTLKFNVPVDLPVDHRNLPGRQIQQRAVDALRLESNWSRKESIVKRLTRIPHVGTVRHLQFLGPSFIVVLSQAVGTRPSTNLSILRVPGPDQSQIPTSILSIELPHTNHTEFTASYSNDTAIIAYVAGDHRVKSLLQVLSIPLHEVDDSNPPVPTVLYSETRPLYGEIFFDPHISGSIVVAGLAKLPDETDNPGTATVSYQLLIVNHATGANSYSDIPFHQDDFVQLKLYRDILYVIRATYKAISITTHGLPNLEDTGSASDKGIRTLSSYRVDDLSPGFEWQLSQEPTDRSNPPLPLFIFHDSGPTMRSVISHYSVPVKADSSEVQPLSPNYQIPMATGAAPVSLCPGESGHRLVWLERRFDTPDLNTEFVVMKAGFDKAKGATVAPVWPNYVALPFQLQSIQTMYFEECTGKICIALHTEEIYVVEL